MYNYICNQCLSSIKLLIRIQLMARCTGFLPGTAVSTTNKDDSHDITKTLLKVALDTIALTLTIYIDDHLVKFLPESH